MQLLMIHNTFSKNWSLVVRSKQGAQLSQRSHTVLQVTRKCKDWAYLM